MKLNEPPITLPAWVRQCVYVVGNETAFERMHCPDSSICAPRCWLRTHYTV